ncbi:MAG: pyruvate kinase [Acidithiobacillus ferrivorans]
MMKLPTQRSKIACTIGPASDAPKTLKQMIRAGMTVGRLNFTHGTPDAHRTRIARFRLAPWMLASGPHDRTGALDTGHLKSGAPARGERVAKYHQSLRIETAQ